MDGGFSHQAIAMVLKALLICNLVALLAHAGGNRVNGRHHPSGPSPYSNFTPQTPIKNPTGDNDGEGMSTSPSKLSSHSRLIRLAC
jgi:hypothetical protein